MIEFIKEYGITNLDYSYIMHNLKKDIIEAIALNEKKVREVLDYYNTIGIDKNLSKIIMNRPDLILISLENLKDLFSRIDAEVLINIIDISIEDLVLLGI